MTLKEVLNVTTTGTKTMVLVTNSKGLMRTPAALGKEVKDFADNEVYQIKLAVVTTESVLMIYVKEVKR